MEQHNLRRRTFVTGTGGIIAAALAGCTGEAEDDGRSEENSNDTDNSGSENTDADESEEEEMNTEDVENRAEGEDVISFKDLEIIEHESEVRDEEYGDDMFVVSGVVENSSDKKYDSIFVGVRAYNEDGHQMDQYLDSTSDLQGGGTWAFEVQVYDVPAEDVHEWDLGVWGHQF